ncbi:hypothetical protein CERZMDRAFT_33078, partial [Cercospora zeae-maydis SCOH1-5]
MRITKHGSFRVQDLECSLCDKSFGRPSDLTRHLSGTHRCFTGAKTGTTIERLRAQTVSKEHHLTQARTHEPALACGWKDCRQILTNNGELMRHRREHGDLRPVKCPICGKGLSRMDKLKPHMKLH